MITVVVIGRDEGPRLERCLDSVLREAAACEEPVEVLYVDSGSRDGSLEHARRRAGVRCHSLGPPPGAARARNLGILRGRGELVQLLDGDMELEPGWLTAAARALREGGHGAVAGGLRERRLRANLWNRTFGLDWRRAEGPTRRLGGAALWSRELLLELGGFDEELAVGEDPDLSLRAAARGASLRLLDRPMATHDLDLRGPRCWWRRALAVGRSRALVARRHPLDPEARREVRRPLVSTLALLPLAAAAPHEPRLLLAGMAVGLALFLRHVVRDLRRTDLTTALVHSLHVHAVKVPVALGILSVRLTRARSRP